LSLSAPAISGSWVVRGEQLLGYIVAIDRRSSYSYMMSIDSVFKSIQDFFATQNVRLFSRHQSENEFESIVLSQASAVESGTLNKRDLDSKQKSPEALYKLENEFEISQASADGSGTLNKRDPDSKQKSPEAPYNSFNVDSPSGFSGYPEPPVGFTETPLTIEEVSLFYMPDDV
jgi:hypothetical protein